MPTLSIRDYGIIGNYTSAALVSRLGSIDWCCFPYLDSPSHFAAIAGSSTPEENFRSVRKATFVPNSAIGNEVSCWKRLFETPFGRAVLTDWMPLRGFARPRSP